MHGHRLLAAALTAAIAVLGQGCTSEPPPPRQAAPGDQGSVPDRTAPALPRCPEVGDGVAVPAGLTLPPGSVVLETTTDGPLTSANGFIALDPVAVHGFYDDREDLELVTLEEEGFEAEVLYGDERRRVYVKARIVCEGGSTFTAVVGDRAAADEVPTPAGSPAP